MSIMQFIEMTGKQLLAAVNQDEFSPEELEKANIREDSIVRINRQGDIEVRRPVGWDLVGGLIGEFEKRIQHASGHDWA
ncbi:MAG: hypothetical protein WD045_05385 [Pirellulaceae bacterium]